ncbi:Murein DD-endopeptidase MepM and murein hydrolase activator NlpD, contain LysM domain [Cnuella takakiae]|uniref:Murein DD-endopeptidase MepM and murein hydrolase activator NlpD, contain LysM domain n=1 Tax=Cnuella takakiae TaxID=1302690 RepID=A0A1M5BNV1_9BACT|nr:M23 family metallopeptidase [Cnuella takakiae]OLY93461.1 hypothetical protein BUE76_17405 [Cnuella takakiae]SHF44293.1 Murein DD-endopeptidase MepM and murein hydrolase activator NlpD, contain LysM domain [Cnuella takakiae]
MRIFLLLLSFCFAATTGAQINITLYSENNRNGATIYADNNEHYPVSLQLNFTLENMRWRNYGQKVFVVPARAVHFRVTELEQELSSRGFRFSYNYRSVKGNVEGKGPDSTLVYDLPFQTGKGYQVMQGYNGRFSHQGVYALDFQMDESSTITAAREGVIAEVVSHNEGGCPERACAGMANFITILHTDGSFTEYAHLKKNGALVKVGQKVKRGEPIGLSGNTGFSSAPHLHFVVFLPGFEGRKTLPGRFRTGNGSTSEQLEAGRVYLKDY